MSRPASATSWLSTSSFSLEKLAKMIQCRVCMDLLKDPRILNCHHTFCSACLQGLMNASTGRDSFLCPVDREVVRFSSQHGVGAFAADYRMKDLLDLYQEMVDERRTFQHARSLLGSSFLDDVDMGNGASSEFESAIMKVDISVQRLNEAVKDIKHAAAMTQTAINDFFEDISSRLKIEQKKLLDEVTWRSQRQIDNIEFEKYRLIETKKSLHDRVIESFNADLAKALSPPTDVMPTSGTSTPTPEGDDASSPVRRRTLSGHDTSECCVSLIQCHVGQQMIDFNPNKEMLTKLEGNMANMGSVVCDFELRVSVCRDLSLLNEFPFGLRIGGDDCSDESAFGSLRQPKGLSKRRGFNLVVSNFGKNEIVLLTESFDVKHVMSGTGKFKSVADVAIHDNNLYVVDTDANLVVMLDGKGNVVRTTAGNPALEMSRPSGVATDSKGRVIVTDSLNHRIKIFSPDLKKCVITITSDRKQFLHAKNMNFPSGVCVDKHDKIYVCDTNNRRVVVFTSDGKFFREISSKDFADPRSVAVSDDGHILVTDRETSKLLLFNATGRQIGNCSGIVDAQGNKIPFRKLYGVVVDGTDKIALTDTELDSIFIL